MAYVALPMRDSTVQLLATAAPGLPCGARAAAASARLHVDALLAKKPLRLHAPNLATNYRRLGASFLSNRASRSRSIIAASVEGNVTVEEPATQVAAAEENVPEPAASAEAPSAPAKQLQRGNTMQRRAGGAKPAKVITVQKEQLVPGAVFTGKIRAVQNYGAFVDIGAFTDGLVHISELSASYVKEVQDVVSVGQEVTVRVIEMDERAGRIGLTMRDKENEATEQPAQGGSGSQGSGSSEGEDGKVRKIAGRGGAGAGARSKADDNRKATNLTKGQELKGTVKNIIRNGAFIELPEGEEGFLRGSEITEGGENVAVESLVTIGQEVNVRVLRIERGKVNLTMKAQVDMKSINKSINKNDDGTASNPFEVFFRNANLIGAAAAAPEAPVAEESAEEQPPVAEAAATQTEIPAVEDEKTEEPAIADPTESAPEAAVEAGIPAATEDEILEEPVTSNQTSESADADASLSDEQVTEELVESIQEMEKIAEAAAEDLMTEDKIESAVDEKIEESPAPITDEEPEAAAAAPEPVEEAAPAPEASAAPVEAAEPAAEQAPEAAVVNPTPEPEEPSVAEAAAPAAEETPEQTPEPALTLDSVAEPAAAELPAAEPTPKEALEPTLTLDSVAPAAPPAPEAAAPKAAPASGPTAAQVKELREATGAGMMECKKALLACDCDLTKATDFLRKKGLASADKKASRIAAEGRVGSYVHDGRIGVLIEVNCETDFVSRGDQFRDLVADMGMQVVACPAVEYVSVDDISPDYVQKEKDIESGKEDLANKPPQIREKIVEGRVAKRLAELALLEQAYIRDDKVLVKDVVKQTIATLGEKVQVRRFVRFNLGEGLLKKSNDFAAEVAAQTAAKAAEAKPAAEAPKLEEANKEDDTPKVQVSAARVKELRDATGAGMMDCKKALAACGNDVAEATAYLRKKGLASAEKKAGRVASEGLVGSYIHDGRIGVLIEVNSETDFVARSAQFKELVADLGMQVAACPQVQYVSVDEIPAAIVDKEKEIEAGKEDLAKKPEAVRGKIVEGRVAKTLNELALLEQPFIRDDKILVKDHIKAAIAALGENIQVRRFARFNLGEGIEKRSTDFAAEVAAQTAAKV